MYLDNKIGITEKAMREHIKSIDSSDGSKKCNVTCLRHEGKWALVISLYPDGKEVNYVMSSQREKVRSFATLEAARKACNFIGGMLVIGE